jgi:hypothetical protein
MNNEQNFDNLQSQQLNIVGVINRFFCRHKANKIWSIFENGDVVRECNRCGKRYDAGNVGTLGYLSWIIKVKNGL